MKPVNKFERGPFRRIGGSNTLQTNHLPTPRRELLGRFEVKEEKVWAMAHRTTHGLTTNSCFLEGQTLRSVNLARQHRPKLRCASGSEVPALVAIEP